MEEDVVGEAAGEHVEDFGADGELAFPGKLGERDCVRLVVFGCARGRGLPSGPRGGCRRDRDPRGKKN